MSDVKRHRHSATGQSTSPAKGASPEALSTKKKRNRALGFMRLVIGLSLAVGAFLTTSAATMLGAMPGTEAKYRYPNYHPLRRLAMQVTFTSGIIVVGIGTIALIRNRRSL
ncbi:hypothetical protein ACS3SW_08860 [Roseobacteraceae bacterium S113]